MKVIRIRQQGSLDDIMNKQDIKDDDFNDILDLCSIIVDSEITGIYLSNHFTNLQIKNNRKIPAKWIFSNIDIENAEIDNVFTFDEVIKLYS